MKLCAFLHEIVSGIVAPRLSEDGIRGSRKVRRDRVLGWIEVCPRCRAFECQCSGSIHG